MSDLLSLLTTFTGRISRKQWWIGFVITLIGSLAGTLPAFAALFYLLPHAGTLIDPGADWTGAILFWAFFLTLIAAFVDNGFLRGTRGPNRFGPDPLAGAPQSA